MKSLALKPVVNRSTVDQVVDRIKSVIELEKLKPGTKLPGEHELVERLQVSRPVLREAIARLQSMGLLEVKRGSGTYVGGADSIAHCIRHLRTTLTVSPKELSIYTELRTAIEVQAARQAALRASDEDIRELHQILQQLKRSDQKYAELLEIDFRFHRKIIDMAGNPLMKSLIEVIYEFILIQMTKTTPLPRDNAKGTKLHAAIVEAIEKRDEDLAEKAMRRHMDVVLEILDLVPKSPSDKHEKVRTNTNRQKARATS